MTIALKKNLQNDIKILAGNMYIILGENKKILSHKS